LGVQEPPTSTCQARASEWKSANLDLEEHDAPKTRTEVITYSCDSIGSTPLNACLKHNIVQTGLSSKRKCPDVVDMALVPMSADEKHVLDTSCCLATCDGQESADSLRSIMDARYFDYGGSFIITASDDDVQGVPAASTGTWDSMEVAADTGGIEEHQNRQKLKHAHMSEVIEHQDACIASLTAKHRALEEELSVLRAQLLRTKAVEADHHGDEAPNESILPEAISSEVEEEVGRQEKEGGEEEAEEEEEE